MVQGFRISKLSLFICLYKGGQAKACFCLVLVVYRLPDLFLHFFIHRSKKQNQNCFLYQKMGCPGLPGIEIISIYMFILQDRHRRVSGHCWWSTDYLICFYICYTKIQECKIKFSFLYQKNGCPGLQAIKFISVYNPFTMEGQPYACYVRCW